jgi:predicted nucleotidyltransferase
MDKKEAIKTATKYKELLQTKFDIEKLYLFGSYANGKFNNDSDIDIAVVLNKFDDDYLELRRKFWTMRRKVDVRIEPVIFEKNIDPTGFLNEIVKTGIEI